MTECPMRDASSPLPAGVKQSPVVENGDYLDPACLPADHPDRQVVPNAQNQLKTMLLQAMELLARSEALLVRAEAAGFRWKAEATTRQEDVTRLQYEVFKKDRQIAGLQDTLIHARALHDQDRQTIADLQALALQVWEEMHDGISPATQDRLRAAAEACEAARRMEPMSDEVASRIAKEIAAKAMLNDTGRYAGAREHQAQQGGPPTGPRCDGDCDTPNCDADRDCPSEKQP